MRIALPLIRMLGATITMVLALLPSRLFAEAVEDKTSMPANWMDAAQWMSWFWNLEIVRIGEVNVMSSEIISALLLLTVGIWLARRISRSVSARLAERTQLDISAATAVGTLLFYVLLIIVILLAIQALRIPITMFAFFGGAIAIGVGLGAQSIFNNFISGLILMLDRPIRLGDTVQIGDNYGKIAEIGARCTRLHRFDGIDVLVPNSTLLENDVVNWTLADRQVRQVVRVGIAYGSDVRHATDLLLQAANEQPEVLKGDTNSSHVLFEDFGDDALVFELFFWLELDDSIAMRIIRSNIRYRIEELFREGSVTIAFPQRDTHLDTIRPLEIRMIADKVDAA